MLRGPAPTAPAAVGTSAACPADRSSDLSAGASLHDIAEAVPGLREELIDRARTAGLLVGWVAVLAMPVWTLVDRVATPEQAGTFLLVRLLSDIPMVLALGALWRSRLGRSRPEALIFFVLAVVQMEIAWMITQAEDPRYHLLGFTLAIYGSGCVLVARPRWTAALIGVSWAALGVSMLLYPGRLTADHLIAVTVYLGTASIIAILAHLRRYALNNRELLTRARLEREQQRTGVLLAQLERLSHEDPLTGLANRRRWDAELSGVCASARQRGAVVGVVLLDADHFKTINDRHGHPGGDEALRQVARILSERVRGGDLVARLGGDEFAVLLPDADLDRAIELAERLRAEAAALIPAGFGSGEVRLSLGVAAAAGPAAYPLLRTDEPSAADDAQQRGTRLLRAARRGRAAGSALTGRATVPTAVWRSRSSEPTPPR